MTVLKIPQRAWQEELQHWPEQAVVHRPVPKRLQRIVLKNNNIYMVIFQTPSRIYKGLGDLYGELHLFFEERESPEKTSEDEED